ncbi:tautomerase PptA [Streptomyces caatingaensis]|uniref:4-oxalocrotonate tautomerase n=1 Tax=Streptomyces caatingaensis TaxID=1678637 RepID=A0A0K9XKC0_9ACTN|nr:tautomerase PptA [Streptomyces caatingaensis]KNB53738.1 4-oxalocrotonate tautomerase [Streptomyces caatingaensis]
MPHINIKHFPKDFTGEERERLAESLTDVITRHFGVSEDAVSVALEPVEQAVWNETVHGPEITGRPHLLIKHPNY